MAGGDGVRDEAVEAGERQQPGAEHEVAAAAIALLAVPTLAETRDAGAASAPLACLDLAEMLAREGRVALQGVHFDFNRAVLRPESVPALVAARDAIAVAGGAWRIEGHTDDVGSRDYNARLSEARAIAVRDWLVAAGVPASDLSTQGFAFDRPIADNATEAGRARNRRVELVGTVDPDMLGFGGPADIDPCPAQAPSLASLETAPAADLPPRTGWQGVVGRDWVEFSVFQASGRASQDGEGFETLSLPPGTQPQTCQALCLAEAGCAAWSFEPAGSHFVSDARCMRYGYGAELALVRANGYQEDGGIFVTGTKPDATNLVADTAGVADEILADMAEIAAARAAPRLSAPAEIAPGAELTVVVSGPSLEGDYVEIAELGDWSFYYATRAYAYVVERGTDGSLVLVAPEAGDYVLRYIVEHPRAGRHALAEQPIRVRDGASPVAASRDGAAPEADKVEARARTSSVEPGIDRPADRVKRRRRTRGRK